MDDTLDEDAAEPYYDYRDTPYVAPTLTDEQETYADHCIDLLCRKGCFPYSWMTTPSRLQATELPTRACFYSYLYERECSEEDYAHGQRVWTEFQCRNMDDYMLLYLSTDVLLLASIFESFRDLTLRDYSIDPAR